MKRRYKVGQIITFDRVWGWSASYGRPTGKLREFVITKCGQRNEILWYPYLVNKGPYRTVVSIPDKLRIRSCR